MLHIVYPIAFLERDVVPVRARVCVSPVSLEACARVRRVVGEGEGEGTVRARCQWHADVDQLSNTRLLAASDGRPEDEDPKPQCAASPRP